MTEIERKALALVNEVLAEWGVLKNAVEVPKNSDAFARALLRAIEQHEAFRQEVSDAVGSYIHDPQSITGPAAMQHLRRFIIAKPDPLVEAFGHDLATDIRAAIEKRGGKIVWGEG